MNDEDTIDEVNEATFTGATLTADDLRSQQNRKLIITELVVRKPQPGAVVSLELSIVNYTQWR